MKQGGRQAQPFSGFTSLQSWWRAARAGANVIFSWLLFYCCGYLHHWSRPLGSGSLCVSPTSESDSCSPVRNLSCVHQIYNIYMYTCKAIMSKLKCLFLILLHYMYNIIQIQQFKSICYQYLTCISFFQILRSVTLSYISNIYPNTQVHRKPD